MLLCGTTFSAAQTQSEVDRIVSLGKQAERQYDYASASRLYRIAAGFGNAESAFRLYVMCRYDYVPNSDNEWLEWLKRAGDLGDDEANYKYCLIILKGGRSSRSDHYSCEERIEKLAKKGHRQGMVLYGDYLMTYDTKEKAMVWYKKAAAKGEVYGALNAGYYSSNKVEQRNYYNQALRINPRSAKEFFAQKHVMFKP